MTRRKSTCLYCRQAGKRGRYVEEMPAVSYCPTVAIPGRPVVHGTRLNAEMLAELTWDLGTKVVLKDYYPHIRREHILVACWWAGTYGPRKWQARWGHWADVAEGHLWYCCINVPDPPNEEQLTVAAAVAIATTTVAGMGGGE